MSRPVNRCDWCLIRSCTVVRVYFEGDLVYWLCERCRDDLQQLRKTKVSQLT